MYNVGAVVWNHVSLKCKNNFIIIDQSKEYYNSKLDDEQLNQ